MSISMDGITSMLSANATDAASTTSKVESKLNNADFSTATDDELMDVCRDFEAYFIEQMFKEMQATVPESESTDSGMSTMKEYYTEQLTQEYASQATEGEGLGLAQMLYEQMKRNYNL